MAPYPDPTSAETSSSPQPVAVRQEEDSALPGMKRGIAIGVACSVGIIVIALVAFFAYRRRKQQAAKPKHTKLSPEEPVEMDAGAAFWSQQEQEKSRHVQAIPIEADARTIHELDGSEVPELPGHYEPQELAIKKTPRASYHAGDEDAFGANAQQWHNWNVALDNHQHQPALESARNSNPYLEVSPTRQATSISPVAETMFYPPAQNASLGVSPIAPSPSVPSPLDSAHFTPPRTGHTHQQRYYDQARRSR
ncbi:hypothetical protein C7974DRAFT_1129 [Boeremia exigua]|uniref:uncharacterized protein n=1 Tax=Boeremia exigua TaxID=749465 RepID=UPI001E8E5CD4|nr:uncharacterized protein C7974DRAFT_1129 [Boeremia exigua]KAH6643596.1 hypothetical protein C7974DRAFT_1129 [Boeremia exigua]